MAEEGHIDGAPGLDVRDGGLVGVEDSGGEGERVASTGLGKIKLTVMMSPTASVPKLQMLR